MVVIVFLATFLQDKALSKEEAEEPSEDDSGGDKMKSLFLTILDMSLTASYTVVAVMVVRLLLRKSPKVFSYALWGIVFFRLLCPFSLESPLSLSPAPKRGRPLNKH
jgi:hypothetical protein